jgi:hypothetical protein
MLAVALMASVLAVGSASAADQTYVAARGGIFLPNGRDGGDYKGFKYFDTGYSFDIAAGYRPVSYAALELGTGIYTASGTVNRPSFVQERSAYGVPITLTAKGILEFDRLLISGGAGLGLYQGFINNKIHWSTAGIDPVDETSHGTAMGYQVVFDTDFKVNEHWTVGANFKWFSARPEIEMQSINATETGYDTNKKSKWEIGGTTVNLGVKYFF